MASDRKKREQTCKLWQKANHHHRGWKDPDGDLATKFVRLNYLTI